MPIHRERVCDWDHKHLRDWLFVSKLSGYIPTFARNEIVSGSILAEMDSFDLTLLNIKEEDQILFLSLISDARKGSRLTCPFLVSPDTLDKSVFEGDPRDLFLLQQQGLISTGTGSVCDLMDLQRNSSSESSLFVLPSPLPPLPYYSTSPTQYPLEECLRICDPEYLSTLLLTKRYSVQQVGEWLKRVLYSSGDLTTTKTSVRNVVRVFKKQEIDGKALLMMSLLDFKRLNLPKDIVDVLRGRVLYAISVVRVTVVDFHDDTFYGFFTVSNGESFSRFMHKVYKLTTRGSGKSTTGSVRYYDEDSDFVTISNGSDVEDVYFLSKRRPVVLYF